MNAFVIPSDLWTPVIDERQTVEIVSDFATLLGLKSAWDDVVAESGINHPFLNHSWICNWWKCFGADNELHIVLIRDGERHSKILGIAPLMRRLGPIYGISFRQLSFLHNDHIPRTDFICRGNPERISRALWHYLLTSCEDWDVLVLPQMMEGALALKTLPAYTRKKGFFYGIWPGEVSPYVPLRVNWNNYFQNLSYNHRARVRKGLHRLARLGNVTLDTVTVSGQIPDALEQGLRIEAAAWKADAGTAINSMPDVLNFYRQLASDAANDKTLRLLFLSVAGKRIAFAFALCTHHKLYVLKAGYDPDFAYYSPYQLLCYLVLKDGSNSGLLEYEFLGRDEPWKLDWTRQSRMHYWLYVFASGWRARAVFYLKFQCVPKIRANPRYRGLIDFLLAVRKWL